MTQSRAEGLLTRWQKKRRATYVDNFLCFRLTGCSQEAVKATHRWEKELHSSGLPTHPVESGQDIEFVVLSLDGSRNVLASSRRSGWKNRLSFTELLRRRRCCGTVLECLLGHYTRQALVATPALCVFEECHKLVRRSRHRTEPLSRVVGNEIQLTVSLLPLLVCDLSMRWSPTSYCRDSSPYKYSNLRRKIGRKENGRWGRQQTLEIRF